MNESEFSRIMQRIGAAWPRPPIAVETLAIWSEHLQRLEFQPAWEAVQLLERSRSKQPSIAEFHEAYEARKPARQIADMALEEPWVGPEQAKANIARLNEILASHKSNIDAYQATMPHRGGKVKYPEGSPASRRGTRTHRSRGVEPLRYSQLYPKREDEQ